MYNTTQQNHHTHHCAVPATQIGTRTTPPSLLGIIVARHQLYKIIDPRIERDETYRAFSITSGVGNVLASGGMLAFKHVTIL